MINRNNDLLNQNDKYKLDKGPYKLYKFGLLYRQVEFKKIGLGVKPIIHQSELRTYTKVVPLKKNSSFRFVVLWKILNGME